MKKFISATLVAVIFIISMVPQTVDAKVSKSDITWKSCKSITNNELHDVAYGNGVFVAVGLGGTILVSEDGTNWESVDSGTDNGLMGVASSGSMFVAVGYNGIILTSSDGYDWTQLEWEEYYWFFHLTGVTWSGDRFVAKGFNHESETMQEVSVYSDDGYSWGLDNTSLGTLWSEWVGDFFFSSSNTDLVYSPDGVGYRAIYSYKKIYISDGAYSGSRYVFVGSHGGIVYTDDLDSWKEYRIKAGNFPNLYSITWTGSEFVSVGEKGTIVMSKDGKSWTEDKKSPTFTNLYKVCYGDGKLVAVGAKGSIIYGVENSSK